MYKKQIATAAAAAVLVGLAAIDAVKVTKQERAKREQIRLEAEKEIAAIKHAAAVVDLKIKAGEYSHDLNKGIPAILNDLKFYRMTDRFNEEN